MPRVLVTGMSGTGKSTVLAELAARGLRVVDTDDAGWSAWLPLDGRAEGDRVWVEDVMTELLGTSDDENPLVVSGCVSNQGRFYDRFEAVVLLSAPAEVILQRLDTRTTNDFGKTDAERRRILADLAEVEPLLRATATHELDAARSPAEIADALEAIAQGDVPTGPVVVRRRMPDQ